MFKEIFYSVKTIDAQAQMFFDKVKHLRKSTALKIIPNKTALLVIDMQKYFAEEASHAFIPSMSAIIPRIKKLQDHFLQHDLTVIQTKHANTRENAGMMQKWWPSILEASDPYTEIVDELRDAKIKIITKTQYDAFWQTDLEQHLKSCGIEQIIITGVMTHLCCETTARSAFVRGFEVFFTIDATATFNSEFQLATLLNLAHGFATPILTAEL